MRFICDFESPHFRKPAANFLRPEDNEELAFDTMIQAAVREMRPRFPPLPLPLSRQLRNKFTIQ